MDLSGFKSLTGVFTASFIRMVSHIRHEGKVHMSGCGVFKLDEEMEDSTDKKDSTDDIEYVDLSDIDSLVVSNEGIPFEW